MTISLQNSGDNIGIRLNTRRTPSKVAAVVGHVAHNDIYSRMEFLLRNEAGWKVGKEAIRSINGWREEIGSYVVDGFDERREWGSAKAGHGFGA